jgi:hypothetical protein
MNDPQWLNAYTKDGKHSQCGEDGILKKIFDVIGVKTGWCVEFGAGDGITNSNTFLFIRLAQWNAVMIESEDHSFQYLKLNHGWNPKVTCIHKTVECAGDNSLDTILSKTPCPSMFDLLSIDIDSYDLAVWESLIHYHPRVVIIEYNPTMSNTVLYRSEPGELHNGNSPLSIVESAKKRGYGLAAATLFNAIFVRYFEDYKKLNLNTFSHRLDTVRSDYKLLTEIWQGDDGVCHYTGAQASPWLGVMLDMNDLQPIPEKFRKPPHRMDTKTMTEFVAWRDAVNKRHGRTFSNVSTSRKD